jgi:hypothetical protein
MTSTATETTPQVNGDTTYSSKFLPKVTSIPVVNSLKKQLFIYVPQAETLSTYVGTQLTTAFAYTDNTPIQPMLIKLDTLAADGVAKLQKEVPIVDTPTNEVLKKTKIDHVMDLFTHYYVVSVDFVFNIFNAYKGVFDPVLLPFLDRFEAFLDIKSSKDKSTADRFAKVRAVVIEKVDSKVTPILTQTKETVTSIYTNKVVPLAQYPANLFSAQKEKATEVVSPYVSELTSRYTKAESAAKDAWTKTKPDISGPNSIVPTVKSGIFVVITFGYNLVYPESKKQPSPHGVEDQTNGLVSGVELSDGHAKKRTNGSAF